MSVFQTAACRTGQAFIRLGKSLRPSSEQTAEEGEGTLQAAAALLRSKKIKKPLIVCPPDRGATAQALRESLEAAGLSCAVWDRLPRSPGADDAENIRLFWLGEGCDGFAAIGPAAALDAVKLAAVRAACPGRSAQELLLRGRTGRWSRPVLAVASLDGGAAVSLAEAAVRDRTGRLRTIAGPGLTPRLAVLDPASADKIPAAGAAEAGMEALTRAVESYLSPLYATAKTRDQAARAAGLLLQSLEGACRGDAAATLEVLQAYQLAGLASGRTGDGYAGAAARAIEQICAVPAGRACAATLPMALEDYGKAAEGPLARLAAEAGVAADGDDGEKARALLWQIQSLANRLGLPELIAELRRDDVPEAVDLILARANPRLCSPAVWSAARCRAALEKIKG